jgi:hypothetical protein
MHEDHTAKTVERTPLSICEPLDVKCYTVFFLLDKRLSREQSNRVGCRKRTGHN